MPAIVWPVERPSFDIPSRSKLAFTLVELIATIAIVAMLAVVLVVFIGDYIADAKKTTDKQTLTVLNDALTRYKTQGGDLTALTAGASIGNVLNRLQTPVSWAGMTHQFLKTGTIYTAASLGAIGEGARYRFTKYGSFADGSAVGSDILETYADAGYDVGDEAAFDEWITQAMAETGTTNYLALTNPDTTSTIQIGVRVAQAGDKVRVWWGDGATRDLDSISTSSTSVISRSFSGSVNRTIVIVGNLSRFESNFNDGRTEFGGDLGTMNSLTYIMCLGGNTVTANVADFSRNMTYFNCSGTNTVTGNLSDLPPSLVAMSCLGSNTISGNLSGLPNGLSSFSCQGNNTITGDVANLPPNMATFICHGNNTISGNLSNLPALTSYFFASGDSECIYNTISGLRNWTSPMKRVYVSPANTGVFTSAMVDALLVDLSSISSWTADQDINLTGNCGARTAASDAAVATLQGNGVTVSTN